MQGSNKKQNKKSAYREFIRICRLNHRSIDIFKSLLNNPLVDPSSHDFDSMRLVVEGGYYELVCLLLADPRMAPIMAHSDYGFLAIAHRYNKWNIVNLFIGHDMPFTGCMPPLMKTECEARYKQQIEKIIHDWEWTCKNFKYYSAKRQEKIFTILCVFNRLNKTIGAQISKDMRLMLVDCCIKSMRNHVVVTRREERKQRKKQQEEEKKLWIGEKIKEFDEMMKTQLEQSANPFRDLEIKMKKEFDKKWNEMKK